MTFTHGRRRARTAARCCAALVLAAGAARLPAAPLLHAYVGTYTAPPRPAGAPVPAPLPGPSDFAHGRGIYLVDIDAETGALANPRLVAETPSPTWLVADPAGRFLYAANEDGGGTVSAFRIAPGTHALTPINAQPTGGAPVHLALAGGGRYILAANYGGGSVAVLPIRADGGVGPATDVRPQSGPAQPPSPTLREGDGRAAVHMAGTDHRDRFVFANESMGDRLFAWRLDRARGTLVANDPPFFAVPRGSFPRHFVLSPDDRHLYDLDERDGMLSVFDVAVQGADARLSLAQRVATLPAGFQGLAQGSELLITRDGRHLYAGNRSRDTVASFTAGPNGRLTPTGEVPTGNDHPRSLALDPAERFVFSLNQRGDSITVLRRDPASGRLAPTEQALRIPSPAAMVFVP